MISPKKMRRQNIPRLSIPARQADDRGVGGESAAVMLPIPVAMDSHDAAHYRPPVVPIGRTQESKPVCVLTINEAQLHPDSGTCRQKPIGLSCSDAAAVAHYWGDAP